MPYTPGAALAGLSATLGTVKLGTVDGDGVAWFLQTLEGWDGAEVRAEFNERQSDHGAWASPVYLGARPITLGGKIVAPSRAALEGAMEQLRAAASLTDTVLTVWESTAKQATVRRSGKPLLQYETDTVASYSVMVTAEDPRRYETTLQSVSTGLPFTSGGLTPPFTVPATVSATTVLGQISATNAGTFATRPTFTITGPVSQPRITVLYSGTASTVSTLSYSQDLAAGDSLVIDTDAHTAMLGGASRRRWLSGAWPEIPPGQTVSIQYRAAAYNSSTTLTASWRSAWL